jgi:succinate dehydrogenase / fumarate reductase membrane anchor subunit
MKQSSLKSPLARVKSLGSARSGTMHAWRLRLTAFALLPLTFAFVVIVVSLVGRDYDSARALLGSPVVAILFILFVGAGIWHMTLGMQAIIEDYVHVEHKKLMSLIANICFSTLIGVSIIYALLRLSFT